MSFGRGEFHRGLSLYNFHIYMLTEHFCHSFPKNV